MSLFVQDIESFNRVNSLFTSFADMSGLKMNRDKTFVLLLGPNADKDVIVPFGKIVNIVKILGIQFTLDVESQEKNQLQRNLK